jgi:hypothetical protein
MNTLKQDKRDATLVGVLLEWKPLNEVHWSVVGALESELRESKEWPRCRVRRAIAAYRTHRLVIRQIMGLNLVNEVAA